ncbi:MAG: phosphoribosylglycinamide formyltransferase [bacterium]
MNPLKIAIFASGRGSNFEAIYQAIQDGKLHGEIVLVFSNRADAGALEIARKHGVPSLHLARKQFESDDDFDDALLSQLENFDVEIIALAGYLKKLSSNIVRAYKYRIVNIHPALLPSFGGKGMYGRKVHEAVLDYGCKVSGVTVHLVDDEYDSGAPVLQKCVPVFDDDTPETLAARVLKVEHQIYTEALQLFAENRVVIQGRKVIVKK